MTTAHRPTTRFIAFLLSLFVMLTLLCGCASSIDDSTYSANAAGKVSKTYQGVIVRTRDVIVNEDNGKLNNDKTGALVGGATGGVAGAMIGAGRGSLAMATVGALLGGFGGAYVESKLGTQNGVEYTVRLQDSKQLVTLVQNGKERFNIGAKVLVIVPSSGRSRIVLDNAVG